MERTFNTPLQRVLFEEGRRQNWLAARVGVHESAMSRYVNGLHPSEDLKAQIAQTLGRNVDELWPSVEVAA